jgi:hypothetical protein
MIKTGANSGQRTELLFVLKPVLPVGFPQEGTIMIAKS